MQANSPAAESQEQYALVALIPRPARVTRTSFAAATAEATDAGAGAPDAVVSLKCTMTRLAEAATVLPGLGVMKPAKRKASALTQLPPCVLAPVPSGQVASVQGGRAASDAAIGLYGVESGAGQPGTSDVGAGETGGGAVGVGCVGA